MRKYFEMTAVLVGKCLSFIENGTECEELFRNIPLTYIPCLLCNMKIFTHQHVFFDPTADINCDWSCSSGLSFKALHLLSNSASDRCFYFIAILLSPHLPATQATGM